MKILPPRHLSLPAREWFSKLQTEFNIADSGGLALLVSAAEAYDRARDARLLLAKEGAVVKDRFGQSVMHPGVKVENAARALMHQALKGLGLDAQPKKRNGRPGIGGFRADNR